MSIYEGVVGLSTFITTRVREGLPLQLNEGLGLTGRYRYWVSVRDSFTVTVGAATLFDEVIELQKFYLTTEPTREGFLAAALGLGRVDGYLYQLPETMQFLEKDATSGGFNDHVRGFAQLRYQMELTEGGVVFTHLGAGTKSVYRLLSSQNGQSYLFAETNGQLSMCFVVAPDGRTSLLRAIYEGVLGVWEDI